MHWSGLFGGRQKVYKIPVGGNSDKSLGSSSAKSGMGGRAVYEDDVNLSPYQRYKQAQHDKEMAEAASTFDFGIQPEREQESPAKAPSTSPSLSNYNNKRETTSSTTSGQNARTSTTATSVSSQGANAVAPSPALSSPTFAGPASAGLDRSGTRSKRLYDQGLLCHSKQSARKSCVLRSSGCGGSSI